MAAKSGLVSVVFVLTETKKSSHPKKTREKGVKNGNKTDPNGFIASMKKDDGKYLSEKLGDALVTCLTKVNDKRPIDPISYLAYCLYYYKLIPKKEKESSKVAPSIDVSIVSPSDTSTLALQMAKQKKEENKSVTIDKRNKSGQSVLHLAAAIPHDGPVLFNLLSSAEGINLADRDDHYRTARDVAFENKLEKNIDQIDQWVLSLISNGKVKQLKVLVVDGYDHTLDIADESYRNVLEVAELHKQELTAEFLKSAVEYEEKLRWLHRAICVGSIPHVEYLADDFDIVRGRDSKGRTSLHIATLSEEVDIMKILLNRYPDVLNVGDNMERTALHYAMATEKVDEVGKILVQAGADRRLKDLNGRLPSYYFMNRTEIVAMIREIYAESQ